MNKDDIKAFCRYARTKHPHYIKYWLKTIKNDTRVDAGRYGLVLATIRCLETDYQKVSGKVWLYLGELMQHQLAERLMKSVGDEGR